MPFLKRGSCAVSSPLAIVTATTSQPLVKDKVVWRGGEVGGGEGEVIRLQGFRGGQDLGIFQSSYLHLHRLAVLLPLDCTKAGES